MFVNCNLDELMFYLQKPAEAEKCFMHVFDQASVSKICLGISNSLWCNLESSTTHLRCSVTDNNIDFSWRTTMGSGYYMPPTDNCTATRFASNADKPRMSICLDIGSSNDSWFGVTAISYCRATNRTSWGENSHLKILNIKNRRCFHLESLE